MFVQWHNNASEGLHSLGIPVLELHYEDYHFKAGANSITKIGGQNSTIEVLMEFLNYPIVAKMPEFKWHPYHGYFTEDEKKAAIIFMRLLASKRTQSSLERYFVLGNSNEDNERF